MKVNSILFVLLILGSQIGHTASVNAVDHIQQEAGCVKAVDFGDELKRFNHQSRRVSQYPTEENFMQYINSYNHLVEQVANKSEITSLHEAAKNGDISKIYDLVGNQGVDVNIRGGVYGGTPLVTAPYIAMRRLFSLGANVNATDALGRMSLHAAAFSDAHLLTETFYIANVQSNAMSFLLNRDANIEAQDLLGRTPMFYAILGGNIQAFWTLRINGASLKFELIGAENALQALYVYNDVPIDFEGVRLDTRSAASKEKRTTMAKLILDEEPSFLRTVDPIYGSTPLHWAAFYGDTEGIDFYLEKGLLPTRTNFAGETPMHVAARSNQVEAFLMLKNVDSNLMTIVDGNGRTPSEVAGDYDAKDILSVITHWSFSWFL